MAIDWDGIYDEAFEDEYGEARRVQRGDRGGTLNTRGDFGASNTPVRQAGGRVGNAPRSSAAPASSSLPVRSSRKVAPEVVPAARPIRGTAQPGRVDTHVGDTSIPEPKSTGHTNRSALGPKVGPEELPAARPIRGTAQPGRVAKRAVRSDRSVRSPVLQRTPPSPGPDKVTFHQPKPAGNPDPDPVTFHQADPKTGRSSPVRPSNKVGPEIPHTPAAPRPSKAVEYTGEEIARAGRQQIKKRVIGGLKSAGRAVGKAGVGTGLLYAGYKYANRNQESDIAESPRDEMYEGMVERVKGLFKKPKDIIIGTEPNVPTPRHPDAGIRTSPAKPKPGILKSVIAPGAALSGLGYVAGKVAPARPSMSSDSSDYRVVRFRKSRAVQEATSADLPNLLGASQNRAMVGQGMGGAVPSAPPSNGRAAKRFRKRSFDGPMTLTNSTPFSESPFGQEHEFVMMTDNPNSPHAVEGISYTFPGAMKQTRKAINDGETITKFQWGPVEDYQAACALQGDRDEEVIEEGASEPEETDAWYDEQGGGVEGDAHSEADGPVKKFLKAGGKLAWKFGGKQVVAPVVGTYAVLKGGSKLMSPTPQALQYESPQYREYVGGDLDNDSGALSSLNTPHYRHSFSLSEGDNLANRVLFEAGMLLDAAILSEASKKDPQFPSDPDLLRGGRECVEADEDEQAEGFFDDAKQVAHDTAYGATMGGLGGAIIGGTGVALKGLPGSIRLGRIKAYRSAPLTVGASLAANLARGAWAGAKKGVDYGWQSGLGVGLYRAIDHNSPTQQALDRNIPGSSPVGLRVLRREPAVPMTMRDYGGYQESLRRRKLKATQT